MFQARRQTGTTILGARIAAIAAACLAGVAVLAGAPVSAAESNDAAEASDSPDPVDEPMPLAADAPIAQSERRLGGWSPQFEFGIGVLTQSQDGQTTVPTNSGSQILRDSGDSIVSGLASFGLNALSPVVVESSWKPRLVLRSSVQIPISDGLVADRADLSFNRPGSGPLGDFGEFCPDPVPGSAVPTSTCSLEVRDRTQVNLLWTAGLGLDLTLPTESRIFHVQPAIEYIGMQAQPEGSFKRVTTGSVPPTTTARFTDFIKQVGASENFHGVAAALSGSADAYQEGPWVWSLFARGRAAWFLTEREIATRRTLDSGQIIFVSEPAVNNALEVQWQVMVGFSVRFDPLAE